MRKYVLICFITEMGKDEQEMGVLCNKTGVCAIKNPGLEFCAINAGIQQLSSSGGRGGVLISGDLTSDVFSLQISLSPHCLCRPSFTLL